MTTTPDPNCPLCFGHGRYDDDGDRWIECVCVPENNFKNLDGVKGDTLARNPLNAVNQLAKLARPSISVRLK